MSKRVSFSRIVETRTIDEIDRQSDESRSDEEQSRQFNKFLLLNFEDGIDNGGVGLDDNIDEAIHSDEDGFASDNKTSKPNRSGKQSNSKPSKKPRKKKNKKDRNSNVSDDFETEFDIDLVMRNDENKIDTASTYLERDKHVRLLKVDTRILLPDNELKRMFGKSVVRDDRSKNLSHVGQRSKFVNLRLVDPRQASSMFTGPKMELDDFMNEISNINQQDQLKNESKKVTAMKNKGKKSSKSMKNNNPGSIGTSSSNCPVYFKFVHDREYQEAQKEFVQAVHLAHPEAIVHNLSLYPGHAESLLQLSHIIRLSEDYKQASDMIERALVTFERGFHTRFNLATAQCRLSYRRPENRTFFIVLFEQITSCHRRGLRRTPLEYSKLLLSLEPDNDPLMATQLLDFFALRSGEYDFLVEFFESWWQVQKLPNMNFSLALAYFYKSKGNKQSKVDSDQYERLADEQLKKSLLLFPNFILPLLEACSGEPSSELKKCSYFDYSPYGNKYKTVPETLEVLIELYVMRSFGLWKQKHVLAWLERNVADLVGKFASGELKDDGGKIREHWAQFKKPAPKNLLRHLALCDLKIKMPASASVSTFLAVDPFPPTNAIISYHSSLHQSPRLPLSGGESLPGLFLRSFLPSFSLSEQTAPTSPGAGASVSQENRIDPDEEIALGDFIMNQPNEPRAPDGVEFDTLQSSIRGLATSLTNLLSMTSSSRAAPANAESNSEGNNEQQSDRDPSHDSGDRD